MNNRIAFKKSAFFYFLLLLSTIAYYWLAYQTSREQFLTVLALFILLFGTYFICYKVFSKTHFTSLLLAGVLFRMLLLFSTPNLSDDVYRFIWDGRLAANGINPFSYLPGEILQMPPVKGITTELFMKLNSPNYYTVYPPVLQGIFWVTAKLFPLNIFSAIVFLKVLIVTVEIGNFFLLMRIIKKLFLPKHQCLLYILNPLVIIELTGNVHFEGVMIFFVLLAWLLILSNNWRSSAISLGLGIATKLIPVLFIPLVINKLGWKRGLFFGLFSGLTVLILFAILFDINTIQHLLSSVNLFFRNFEFNAGLYYVVRWIGIKLMGYNIIEYAGPALSLAAIIIIFFLSFRNKKNTPNLFLHYSLFVISIWFLFSTTVHPWYICLPVALSVFGPFRYAVLWSFTVTLSYSAYRFHPVRENLWLVGAGYILVAIYALWEFKFNKKPEYSLSE